MQASRDRKSKTALSPPATVTYQSLRLHRASSVPAGRVAVGLAPGVPSGLACPGAAEWSGPGCAAGSGRRHCDRGSCRRLRCNERGAEGGIGVIARWLEDEEDCEPSGDQKGDQRASVECEGREGARGLEARIADVFTVVVAIRPATARALLCRLLLTSEAGHLVGHDKSLARNGEQRNKELSRSPCHLG